MTVQPSETPAPEATTPASSAPQEPAAAAPEASTPPWGEDFDAEKAWTLVQNLRADKERLSRREALTPDQKQKLAEYDRLAEASKTELERAQEKATTEASRAQALLQRAVAAEVKAVASQGFADPEDAAAFLDLSKYASQDGDIDADAIRNDLADLLSRKPHLGKSPTSRVPAPNPAQGSSATGAPPKLSLDEQIAELEKAGDFKAAGRLKANALLELRKNTH